MAAAAPWSVPGALLLQESPGAPGDPMLFSGVKASHVLAHHHNQARERIVWLCSELEQPHLKCREQFWVPQYKRVIKLLESVRRRTTRKKKGLEGKPYEEQLRSLGLFSLEETERKPHCSYNFLMRGKEGAGTDLFSLVTIDRTQRNGLKLCEGRFRLDISQASSLRGWLGTGTGSPGKWSQHQGCQSSKSAWTMLSGI
ncbi:hypothetical protein TURU_010429 [Turdus rufiventris]|nr:hypothetical protein TURU_010429 [Turdus rufiventris]